MAQGDVVHLNLSIAPQKQVQAEQDCDAVLTPIQQREKAEILRRRTNWEISDKLVAFYAAAHAAGKPRTNEAVCAELPEVCAAMVGDPWTPVLLRRGERARNPFRSALSVHDVVKFNRDRGITAVQVKAMIAGSWIGYGAAAADPQVIELLAVSGDPSLASLEAFFGLPERTADITPTSVAARG